MKTETFLSILREIARDPLTDKQRDTLTQQDSDRIIDTAEAAELLGMSTITLRRIKAIPRVRTNRRTIHYKLSDVMKYRETRTY